MSTSRSSAFYLVSQTLSYLCIFFNINLTSTTCVHKLLWAYSSKLMLFTSHSSLQFQILRRYHSLTQNTATFGHHWKTVQDHWLTWIYKQVVISHKWCKTETFDADNKTETTETHYKLHQMIPLFMTLSNLSFRHFWVLSTNRNQYRVFVTLNVCPSHSIHSKSRWETKRKFNIKCKDNAYMYNMIIDWWLSVAL